MAFHEFMCVRRTLVFVTCGLILLLVIANWQTSNYYSKHSGDNASTAVHVLSPSCQERRTGKAWRRVNSIITDYDSTLNETLHGLIKESHGPTDPELVSLVRDLMDPPSEHMIKLSRQVVETPQSQEISTILKKKVKPTWRKLAWECPVHTFF